LILCRFVSYWLAGELHGSRLFTSPSVRLLPGFHQVDQNRKLLLLSLCLCRCLLLLCRCLSLLVRYLLLEK
jgi:hypothetical protein